jgi:hypothetical protein
MPDPVPADRRGRTHGPPGPDPVHAIARELLGVLPFGARPDALARCPTLVARVHGGAPRLRPADAAEGARVADAVAAAIDGFAGTPSVPRHPEPLEPGLVRRMLHVLLATRDLGWPGTDAPLGVRRVAAADLFFDATQAVLADDDWKGPHGVEFALLTALAAHVCRTPPAPAGPGLAGELFGEPGVERLGHLGRVRRPHGSP